MNYGYSDAFADEHEDLETAARQDDVDTDSGYFGAASWHARGIVSHSDQDIDNHNAEDDEDAEFEAELAALAEEDPGFNAPRSFGDELTTREEYEAEQKVLDGTEEDDDPQCVCGVYRSEHSMMGCPEGFQTSEQWEVERKRIIAEANRDDDDFPMSVEYDGLWGGDDFHNEQSAQDEERYESKFFGDY